MAISFLRMNAAFCNSSLIYPSRMPLFSLSTFHLNNNNIKNSIRKGMEIIYNRGFRRPAQFRGLSLRQHILLSFSFLFLFFKHLYFLNCFPVERKKKKELASSKVRNKICYLCSFSFPPKTKAVFVIYPCQRLCISSTLNQSPERLKKKAENRDV